MKTAKLLTEGQWELYSDPLCTSGLDRQVSGRDSMVIFTGLNQGAVCYVEKISAANNEAKGGISG